MAHQGALSGTWHPVWQAETWQKIQSQRLDSNSGNTLATQQWVRGRDSWKKRKYTSYPSTYLMVPFIYFYMDNGDSKMENMNSTTDTVSRCWVIASDPVTAVRPEQVIRPLGPKFAGPCCPCPSSRLTPAPAICWMNECWLNLGNQQHTLTHARFSIYKYLPSGLDFSFN